jgi:hypothetical protein
VLVLGVVTGSMPEWEDVCFPMWFVHICITREEAEKRVEISVVYTRFTPQEMLRIVSMTMVGIARKHTLRETENACILIRGVSEVYSYPN